MVCIPCQSRHLRRWAALLLVLLLGLGARTAAEPPRTGEQGNPLLVGINRDFPPYEFLNAKGEPDGYDVDLIRAVAQVMGLEVRFRPNRWDRVRADLQAGRVDLLPGLLHSQEREAFAAFAAPHLVVHYSIFVRVDTRGISSLEDLRPRRVLVERGSQMYEHLLAQGFDTKNIVAVSSEPEALRRLAAGAEDAALVPQLQGALQIRDTRLTNVRAVGSPVFARDLCFAVAKDNAELRSRLDTGLAILRRTGEYTKIYRKWFGEVDAPRLPVRHVLKAALWFLVPLLVGVGIVLAWNSLLRRKVGARTLELQQSNKALGESQLFLQTVIDSLPVALFGKDPRQDFRFTIWNAKSEAVFGLKRAQVLGFTDHDFFPPEQAAAFRRTDEEVMRLQRLVDIPEEPIDSKSLGPILLHTVKVPLLDDEGHPRLLLGISEDITQRKRMEAELRKSEASLAEAQRLAALGNWEWDLRSDEMHWSEELFRIFGLDPSGPVPSFRSLLRLSRPGDQKALLKACRAVMAGRVPITLDHGILRPDGSLRHIHSTLSARTEGPERGHRLMGASQDVTERRLAEEALRQAQKLEGLGVLAGGIAHDFNNLLTAILSNLNLLQFKLSGNEVAAPHLSRIEATVLRAAELTRQLLAYSGKGTFVVRALDLSSVAQEITSLLQVSISKKVDIRYRFQPGLPSIEADIAQLQQVIMNLVTNASEAIGDQDGVITLATGTATLDRITTLHGTDLAPGLYVTLSVEDSGCGMGPETLARLFDPFFTTKFSGRGLGLSAMLGILKGHRGGVHIESQPGRGSTFRLFFPPSTSEIPHAGLRAAPAEDVPCPGTRGTFLVVDDEPEILEAASQMLRCLGYEVLEARDGEEAIMLFRAHAAGIQAVLLDLTMPRMDGREALAGILEVDPGARIILCSGYHEQEALRGSDTLRPSAFLAKPFTIQELQAVLAQILA